MKPITPSRGDASSNGGRQASAGNSFDKASNSLAKPASNGDEILLNMDSVEKLNALLGTNLITQSSSQRCGKESSKRLDNTTSSLVTVATVMLKHDDQRSQKTVEKHANVVTSNSSNVVTKTLSSDKTLSQIMSPKPFTVPYKSPNNTNATVEMQTTTNVISSQQATENKPLGIVDNRLRLAKYGSNFAESKESNSLKSIASKRAFTTEDPDIFEKRSSRTEFDAHVTDTVSPVSLRDRGRHGDHAGWLTEARTKRRSRSVTTYRVDAESVSGATEQLRQSPTKNSLTSSESVVTKAVACLQSDADVFITSSCSCNKAPASEDATQLSFVQHRLQQMQQHQSSTSSNTIPFLKSKLQPQVSVTTAITASPLESAAGPARQLFKQSSVSNTSSTTLPMIGQTNTMNESVESNSGICVQSLVANLESSGVFDEQPTSLQSSVNKDTIRVSNDDRPPSHSPPSPPKRASKANNDTGSSSVDVSGTNTSDDGCPLLPARVPRPKTAFVASSVGNVPPLPVRNRTTKSVAHVTSNANVRSPDDLDTVVQYPEIVSPVEQPQQERKKLYYRLANIKQHSKGSHHHRKDGADLSHSSTLSTDLEIDAHTDKGDSESNSSCYTDDGGDDDDDDSNDVHEQPPTQEEETGDVPRHKKVAMELLTTERSYVKTLELIDQVYYMEVINANRKSPMFPDGVCQQMFLNIKSIYLFHSGFLLDKLENTMKRWDEDGEKIGETMKAFAPFLKMYAEYVKNFDNAIALITQWADKSKAFADLLLDIQSRPASGKLALQHHMLAPIQRIPRYQLLLQEYIKRLPATSPDLAHAQKALDLVISANIHGNEAQKNAERFKKLIEINESLGLNEDLIGPTQTLIKEGRITKISAKSGLPQERYLYLFSDVLLLCQPLTLALGKYRLKARLDVEGMRVLEGNNPEISDTFIVQSKQLSLELLASSFDEKMEWHVALVDVIRNYNKRILSHQPLNKKLLGDHDIVGKMAPKWIHDHETSMCMKCGMAFTFFVRRHHCRGCGVVACDKCTEKRAHLEYLGKMGRVCGDCYRTLTDDTSSDTSLQQRSSFNSDNFSSLARGRKVLEVSGADPSLVSGYMHWSADCKRWSRLWFSVHRDFALYCFKAHQDVKALNSIPLPSYKVEVLQRSEDDGGDNIFRITHTKEAKYFRIEDKDQFNRWIAVLQKVVTAELPD